MADPEKTLENTRCAEIGRRCTCYNLRRAARIMTRLYEDFLRPSGLRATQFAILNTAHVWGPVTISKMARLTATERTTLTRNLTVLEKKGMLIVAAGEDRRERRVTITDSGREALLAAIPLWEKAQEHMDQGLGRERMQDFLKDVSEVIDLARK